MSNITAISVLLLSFLSLSHSWWPFSEDAVNPPDVDKHLSDNIFDKVNEEVTLNIPHSEANEVGIDLVNILRGDSSIDDVADSSTIGSDVREDERNQKMEKIFASPEEVIKLDQEAFERKLDEVIKAHEDIHLNDESHVNDLGEHDSEFDHKAFLGDDADNFKKFTPEESKAKLGVIFNKIDDNNDTQVSEEELTIWIKETARRGVEKRTNDFWTSSNPEGKDELSWDEYRAIQYGFLTDGHITNTEGRWINEDDVGPETLKMYKELEQRDRKRWAVADRNKNLQLSKDEFTGFLHPEAVTHMSDILAMETMADFDKDNDGKLDLKEYVHAIFGDTKDPAEWDNGGLQFRTYRDVNRDGYIDKEELKLWIQPQDYDQDQAEAAHLIHEADGNGDKQLDKGEVLENYNIFVASQATDFGAELHYIRDEL